LGGLFDPAELGQRKNRPSFLDHLGELMVIIRPALGTLLTTLQERECSAARYINEQ